MIMKFKIMMICLQEQIYSPLPYIMVGVASALGGSSVVFIAETWHRPLPVTIQVKFQSFISLRNLLVEEYTVETYKLSLQNFWRLSWELF